MRNIYSLILTPCLRSFEYVSKIPFEFHCRYKYNALPYHHPRGYSLIMRNAPQRKKYLYTSLVFDRIKSNNNFAADTKPVQTVNIFDEQQAATQFQSLLLHTFDPSSKNVLNLFHSYTNCSASKLRDLLLMSPKHRKNGNIQVKILSTIRLMTNAELHQLVTYLLQLLPQKIKFLNKMSMEIADECFIRAQRGTFEEALHLFIICTELYGNYVYSMQNYVNFIKIFKTLISDATILQCSHALYFCGLNKKHNDLEGVPECLLEKILLNIDELSFHDLGIAVGAIFKLNLKISENSTFIQAISKKLIHNLNQNSEKLCILDSHSITSIVKVLRRVNFEEDELFQPMNIFFANIDRNSLTPQMFCHIAALYGNSRYYHKEVLDMIEEIYYESLISTIPSIRFKDVSRIMWSFSCLMKSCSSSTLKETVKVIEQFSTTSELSRAGHHYIDLLLSLVILGADIPEHLLHKAFHPLIANQLADEKSGRRFSQLVILHRACRSLYPNIEISDLTYSLSYLPRRTVAQELKHRPLLLPVSKAVKWINTVCKRKAISFEFMVPPINICSIIPIPLSESNLIVKEELDDIIQDFDISSEGGLSDEISNRINYTVSNLGKTILEVDDESNTIKGEGSIIGLEHLKRKILKSEGWKVSSIDRKCINFLKDDVEGLVSVILQKLTQK